MNTAEQIKAAKQLVSVAETNLAACNRVVSEKAVEMKLLRSERDKANRRRLRAFGALADLLYGPNADPDLTLKEWLTEQAMNNLLSTTNDKQNTNSEGRAG